VWKLVRRGIGVEFILFDNWYASRDNLALFERLGLKWVTRCKENAKVYYQGERLTVKQVAATVKKANYHYYSALGARIRSYEVEYGDRSVKLVVIKDDTAAEAGRSKYLMTNALKLTNQETVEWYRKRWTIEVFFRDAKQYLGLAKSEARSEQAVISHVGLVCVAYVILHLLKPVVAQQRPSIRASKNAVAALVVVVQVNWQIVRQKATGRFEEVTYEQLWHPIRTRFHDLACPEFIGDTGLLL
jgi:transposase